MTYEKMHTYDVFRYAAGNERMFEMNCEECGHERKTTFFSDLSIAEWCEREKGVRDTYERVIKEWLDDIEYITEFSVCLNHKIWQHYEDNEPLARVYNELWNKCVDEIYTHYAQDEKALSYYYRITD